MSETAEQLLKKALALSERDRASLAGALIESLHAELEPGAERTWDAEIERRVKELETRAAWKSSRWRIIGEDRNIGRVVEASVA